MNLKQAFKSVYKDLDKFEEQFMTELLKSVKQKTPVDTGKLKNSWHIEDDVIGTTIKYAIYVELGTMYQSPVGMLRRTEKESKQIAEKVAKRIKK